jgi:hypothetical protein
MRLHSRLRECLCLNWAVPVAHLPPAPHPLRYELHAHDGTDYVLASVFMFRHEDVHPETLPLFRLSFPQLNVRLYVLDAEDVPSVLFPAILVPGWVVPTAVLVGRQPARPARFAHTGDPGAESGRWEWEVHAGAALHCIATLGSPHHQEVGPQIGSWQQTVDYARMRNRGYAVGRGGGLKRIETEQPAVEVSPVSVDLRDAELPRVLVGAPSWPTLHSAWVCPEMRMRFDLVREPAMALPRQAPVPG